MARRRVDFDEVYRRLAGRCFICELVRGNPEFRHPVVFEDEHTVAFLQGVQTLYGYVLVAPKEHREQVTGDFTLEEYLGLQACIHRVGEALCRVVPTERLYVLSLGSQALDADDGLDLSEEELEELADRIRAEVDRG